MWDFGVYTAKKREKLLGKLGFQTLLIPALGLGSLELLPHAWCTCLWETEPCDSGESVACLLCSAYPGSSRATDLGEMGPGMLLWIASAKEEELPSLYIHTHQTLDSKDWGEMEWKIIPPWLLKSISPLPKWLIYGWVLWRKIWSLIFETKNINLIEIVILWLGSKKSPCACPSWS